jgi:hypothetical protein
MKKKLLFITTLVMQQWLYAQVNVTTKNFELESVNKHKGWIIIEAGRDSITNKIFVKFAQSICDQTNNAWTGTRTFKGLKWNIDKLLFNDQFALQNNELKSYTSSEEAVLNNEYVFGKTYFPVQVNIGKSFVEGGANIARPLNNAYMFKNIITGTSGITGFKVNTSVVGCEPIAKDTKTQGTLCGERAVIENLGSTDASEQKGQRWIPMYNNPVPNGGNVLFNTIGVSADPNKQHYVFKKFDANANLIKEQSFTFDYQCLPTVKEIEKAPGVFDYVLIMTPINYKKSDLRVAPANQYEYIRVDGESFSIKEQFTFTAPNSQWLITDLTEIDGAVYMLGVAGAKNNVYKDFAIPKWKEYTTFQLAKVANGNLQYVTNTSQYKAQEILSVVPGVKGSAKASFHNTNLKMHAVNNKLLISAQNNFAGELGALVAMVFDGNGNLETYLAKPEEIVARGSLHFTADGKTAYWVLQDLGAYNKYDSKTGVLTANKVKFLANAMHVVKYDIASKQAAPIQSFVNEEWALDYNNTQLYETATEILFLGKKLTKKAKESELVFIQLKK